MPTPELWRVVPSLPDVLASTRGRVMIMPRVANGRHYEARARFGSWDGERYIIRIHGKTYKVARLVCEAFNGAPFDGAVCMHLDENSYNNVPNNLQWGTQKENLNASGFLEYCRARTGENSPVIKGRQSAA